MNISFALTTPQVRAREKTVTRRIGWLGLKEGAILQACEKCQGLGKGGKIVVICKIKVKSVRRERLDRLVTDLDYGSREVVAEGFPSMHPAQFIAFFLQTHKASNARGLITRIEFEYL